MPTPYFKPFDECDPYSQEDAPGLAFHKVLPQAIIPHLDMGLVTAQGPTHKFPGTHQDFDQVYLIFRGKGYVHLAAERIRIDCPGIVVIPSGVEHSIAVDAGELMQYVYVNHRLPEGR